MRNFLLGVLCLASGVALAQEKVQLRVSVGSQPEGATVVIDGSERGTTPLNLWDLAPGRHHLRYRLAGYVDYDCFLDTKEANGIYLEKNAVLEEEKGLLLQKTDPADCDIQIDGVSVGRTPRLITHLAAKGTYDVRLRKAGYQDQAIKVKFDGRKPLVREEKMVLSSGTIEISSEPAGAEVTVNGIVRGTTPLSVTEVPRGRATVKFHLDGYVDEVRELAINAGDVQNLPIVLKGQPGKLQLTSVPDGARFYVNDEAKGRGPLSLAGLKPGEYVVRAELEGFGTATKTVTLGNGQTVSEEFRLSNVMGRVEVRSSPVGAQVFLDGKLRGVTKSKDPSAEFSDVFAIENVMEGEHTIVLKAEGYSDATGHPKVKNSETASASIRLKRIFLPNVEIVTASGNHRGVLIKRSGEYVEIETSPGITRSFRQGEIRDIKWLTGEAK